MHTNPDLNYVIRSYDRLKLDAFDIAFNWIKFYDEKCQQKYIETHRLVDVFDRSKNHFSTWEYRMIYKNSTLVIRF